MVHFCEPLTRQFWAPLIDAKLYFPHSSIHEVYTRGGQDHLHCHLYDAMHSCSTSFSVREDWLVHPEKYPPVYTNRSV